MSARPSEKTGPAEEAFDEALQESRTAAVPTQSIDELVANEDVNGLIELGAAYRAGAGTIPKDAFKAVECFEAASRLGSEEAEYFVGVAFMNGLGVGRDVAQGATRLRSAAQRGSLRAKVYVANLYEMGVHYATDRDKADVWYRNVARAAEVEGEPTDHAYVMRMAELGCVRYCLELVSDEALPTKDRAFYLKKAKAMGYGHRLAQVKRTSAVPEEPVEEAPEAAEAAEASEADAAKPTEAAAKPGPKTKEDEPEADDEPAAELGAQWTFAAGLGAFLASVFFGVSAFYAGWLASEGSRALAAAGRPLPGIGSMHDLVFGAVLIVFGVLPAMASYRPKVVGIGALVGAAAAAGGWFLHPSQPLLWSPAAQAGVFGLGAMGLVLLFLGLLGGTRARVRRPARPAAK
ncbi:MAG: sel1 repeat family protein [Sandaracinaceae bacterium]|nr:sel1 repeat family protein [Sandaracinaceae bacterium]